MAKSVETFESLVASGKPFNPMSNEGQGSSYSQSNEKTLVDAMEKRGLTDPRFVTEKQAESAGWSIAADAKASIILVRNYEAKPGEKDWNKHFVYNAADVIGMPSLDVALAMAKGECDLNMMVNKGIPCSVEGKAYSHEFAKVLSAAIRDNNLEDPRFISTTKIAQNDYKVNADAKQYEVSYKDNQGVERSATMVNVSDVRGPESLLVAVGLNWSQRRIAAGNGTMADLLVTDTAFNPLSGDRGQGRAYTGENQALLKRFMREEKLDDPRFVSKAQVARRDDWELDDSSKVVTLQLPDSNALGGWRKVELVNASQVKGIPSISSMLADANELLYEGGLEECSAIIAKEDRKAAEMQAMTNEGGDAGKSLPPVDKFAGFDELAVHAAKMAAERAAKVEADAKAIEGLPVASEGIHVGTIVGMTAAHAIQDVGQGRCVVHVLGGLDKPIGEGDSLTVKYDDSGKATVTDNAVKKVASQGR